MTPGTVEPPPKRIRRMPCPCSACLGKERDYRTVQSHTSHMPVAPVVSVTPPPTVFSMQPEESSMTGMIGNSSEQDSNYAPTPTSSNEERVQTFLLKELRLKLQYGNSQTEFEQHLRNASGFFGPGLPSKWSEVLKLLREIGYRDPKHYKVCVGHNHSVLLHEKSKECHVCSSPRTSCIDYYVLGLHFEDWFCTQENCEQLLCHWREKDEWLRVSSTSRGHKLSKLWHGSRWRELAYMWDPAIETLLPQRCKHCKRTISVHVIEQAGLGSPQVSVTCPTCLSENLLEQRYMRGDPRNQAIIIHEDGWAPHSTSAKHSTAAITITKGCMSKQDRSKNKNAQVYSFIPADQLPTDSPHKMDAFLEPLISEIEDLYMNGLEVFFKSEVHGFSPANDCALLRVVPLLCTADLRGHSEIGLTSAGGRKGCRRCEVVGQYAPESCHYYYGNFQYRYHYPPALRTAQSNRASGKRADTAATDTERKTIARDTGVTGETVFYRLYDLCRFDPVKDLVIDAMHARTLNLIRSEIQKHLLADMGPNRVRRVLDRDTKVGGVLDRNDLAKALSGVPWTTELKDGRVPTVCPSDPGGRNKLGFWKSEKF